MILCSVGHTCTPTERAWTLYMLVQFVVGEEGMVQCVCVNKQDLGIHRERVKVGIDKYIGDWSTLGEC